MTIKVKRLDSQHEFEAIKVIRSRVFIEEQGISPDLEIDEFDDFGRNFIFNLPQTL